MTITNLVDEDGCCHRLQRVERRHRVDEPLSTFRSFVKNEGSKETTWFVFYLNRPAYPRRWRINVNGPGTGSTYFRVLNKNGHPVLVLEVTFQISGQGLVNLFNGIGANSVILDTFRTIRIVTSRSGPAMSISKVGFDLM